MSPSRVVRLSLLLLLLCTFPLLASAATTDFRILFDVDHDTATGCNVSGLAGVDMVFTTRVDTTASTAAVTQTFRQTCSSGVLGAQIPVDTTGWPAGFQSASGQMMVETRIPFSAFPSSDMQRDMRVAVVGTQGALVHTALVQPNGDPVLFPTVAKGRRRAVGAPGAPRVIILDGISSDWNGLKAKFDGIASGGVSGLRIEKLFGFADTNKDIFYFRFDVNTSATAPLAVNDLYTRPTGAGLTVPNSNGDPTVLANDSDPAGLPLTAQLVSQPPGGSVTLDETGGFTYTPTNPNATTEDSFEYRASNGAQVSNTAKVTIVPEEGEVSGPNQEPSFVKGADPLVLEDSGAVSIANWATSITAGPDEDDTQTVTFVVTGNSNPGLFDDGPTVDANGTLTFTPAADAFGIATISVKITDDGGVAEGGDNESPVQTFFISVDPVNDAPSFGAGADVTVEDDDGAQSMPWATSLSAGPANESGQALNFVVDNNNPGLFSVQPSIAPNGTLTFTPAVGQTGVANVSVQIHDDGGTADGGVDLSPVYVLRINVEKIPVITSGNATTFTVGQAGSFLVTTTGIPRPTLAITGTLPAGVTFVNGTGANKGTGTLSGTPAAGTGGTYPLTFQATNVRGSSPIQNFTLTVNQPPAITSGNTATFVQNAAGTFTITTTGFPAPALSLTGALPAGLSFLDNGNGTATISGTPTAPGGAYTGFTVTASNGVGSNANQSLTVVINSVPAITSANATSFAATVAGTFTVTTTGFPTPSLSETGALPSGITFTDNGNGTATLGGTAVQGSGGVYTITINATNGAGTTPQTFTITVCNVIAVTNPGVTNGTVGTAFSQNFTQTGAVGSATFTTASTLPAGLTLATNGTLSGTPTQFGSFPITVTVTDANGCTGTGATYTLVISCQTITVNNPGTTTGTANAAFSQTFTQTGAIGGATFTTASTLPAGLTLSTAGVLSGTPTQTGVFPIVVTVTDGNGCTGTGTTYNLTIGCQTITVTNPVNANGTANAAFSETFTQTGAIGGATFTTSSTLPAGLTLSAAGVLSGTPTQTGSFPIVVTVTDGNGCTGTSPTYTLVIACQTITVNNPATNSGTVSAAFSQTFTQTGAIGTPVFTTASTLPAGLSMATNGVLSGTPTQTGTFPITVTVTDANGCTGTSATYTLTINCQTITVTNPANTNGTISAPFSETFTQTSAVGGATFTTASTLPAGITLATNGVLSGTPTQTGSFPIVVMVTDGNGCTGTGATYTLVINCQTITVTNPGTTTGTANAAFSQTFTQTGAIGTATFTTASTLPAGLTLSTAGVLSGTPTQTGTFPIVVTVTDSNGCTGTSATYTLVINCQTITVNNPANGTGTANAAFSETFTQTGAIGGTTFTLATGTLPAGLTLATNGVLSGTPTQTGSFPITVKVTDGNGCTGTGTTYTIIIGCQTITVTNPANGNGTAGSAFSETFTQTGGIGTTTFTIATGTLPAGLTLASNGVLSGTPTQTGSFPITVKATDSNGCQGTGTTYTIVIGCQVINVTNPVTTTGTVSAPFSQTFTQTGAIGTATFTTASTLPAGLSLSAAGVLSGTPTQNGSFPIVVTVTDSNGCTGSGATYTLVIGCQTITVTNPANTNGTVSSFFSETFTQSGAVGGATFTTASTLPAGITLSTAGVLSGTPTQNGSFPIVVTVTDGNGCTGNGPTYTLVIACQTITVTNPVTNSGAAGSPFSQTFTQTGAIGSATFTTASTLPTGLTLSAAGVLSGTPMQGGTFPIVVTVTDSNGCTGSGTTYTLTITCPVITVTNPANSNGTANSAFSATFTQTGAVGTATFTLASGSLPAGLTLATNGVLSGTPTQTGSFPITVLVTDSNGCTGTSPTYTITIACQTITVTNPVNANGTANAAFSETFTQTGAIGTATFTVASGTLPTGLTLSTAGVLSGTPTQTGSFPITVKATDSNGCQGIGATYTIVIACQTITVTNPATSTGTILVPFSQTFTQTGAIGTATFSTASSLPAGITLSAAGVLSGTPTVTGTFPIVVTVTDSNGCTGTGATYTLVINCQTITVTNPSNGAGIVSSPFSETFTQTGANGGVTFTLLSGTLPTGLTLAANGVVSGTPLQTGSFPITVRATDGNGCFGDSTTYTIVIGCQVINVTNPGTTTGTVASPFSATFTQTGAVGTATFTTASTLPTGLSLSTAGVLSGTPTQSGTFPITVTVTDSNGCTGTGATYTLTINCQVITVTNPGISVGTVNTAFSQQFTQTGAVGTATFTTASTLPTGLTLATNGTLSGTPTQNGTFPITVTVTDSNGCTGTSATYTLTINCQVITVTNPANANGTAGVAFSETFTQTNGVGAVTFTTSSTLPNGLTLSAAGVLSGTPTQNGTFPIVVTVTDANGCTGTGSTYNLVIACAPMTFNPLTTMPTATYSVAYSQNISISGGTGPWTLSLVNATNVPTSFTFTDNGNGTATVASANPTVTGIFTFDVKAVDTASNCEVTQTFSFTVAPKATNDTYSAAGGSTDSVGNTQAVAAGFSTPTTPYVSYASSVLANDSAPGGTLTVVTPSVTNAAGTITFNAAGGWSYVPALNFTGTATFNFVIASNGAQANASVSIVVTNKVWYVQNNAAGGGTGLSTLPFNTLASAQTASAAGEIIYVDLGDGTTLNQAAGITLKDNQQLIGEGVALVVNSNTLATAGTKPQISAAAAGTVVTLANGNTVKGLTITGSGTGISGGAVAGFTGDVLTIQNATTAGITFAGTTGTVTVTNATISANAIGLNVNAGTATITLDNTNTITANAGQRSVQINSRAAGANTITIGAAITDNGTGISLNANSVGAVNFTGTQTLGTTTNTAVSSTNGSGTYALNFSGTLAITTTTGAALTATNGGTLNITGTANVTTGAAATAININAMTVGASGVTFNSVNTTGAGTGVSLTSIGNGNVTINGGTINATTASLAMATLGTSNVTLNNVTLSGAATAITGATFGTLTLQGTVNVSGTAALSLNTGTVTGTFNNLSSTGGTNGVSLTAVAGTWAVTAGSLAGATGATFNVSGGSGNITLGNTISQANAATAVTIAGSNSATITFNGVVASSGTSTGVSLSASSGTYNFTAANTFTGASGILIANGQSGSITFSNATTIGNVTNAPFQVDGSVAAVTAVISYGGTIAKTSAGALIDVNNLDTPGTLSMTHTPAATGNLSINNNGSMGISVINSSSTNITINNASVTFNNAAPAFTSTANTGGTINLNGIAFTANGNRAGMLLAGAGTINVGSGVAAPSINMAGGSNNAIDGTTTAFTGTLNLNNVAITGGSATAVRLGGGTLGGTNSTVAAGAQTALNLSGVALTNGAGLASITSTGGANGVILANVTGGTYTIGGGSLTGHTTAAWTHTNSAANAATISFSGPITPAINARAIDIGGAAASTGLRGGTVTFSGNITTTSNAANANAGGIRVRNSTAGTLTLSGASHSISSNANIGVELTTNPGATFNFSGGALAISSTSGKAFSSSGGGTVNITGANNTITTTAANGLDVIGTSGTHMAGTVTFKSINAAGGTKGVSMQFFDGPFTIAGDGTASLTTGGTISNMTTRGVELISLTGAVSMQNMTFTNAATAQTVTGTVCGLNLNTGNPTGCAAAIYLESTSVSVNLNRMMVNGSIQGGVVGYLVTNLTMSNIEVQNAGNEVGENGMLFKNLLGTGSATNLNLHNNAAKQLHIINTTNNDLTAFPISSSTFANTVSPNGGQGVLLESFDSGTSMNVSINGGIFTSLFSNAHQVAVNSGSTQTVSLTNSTITNANAWTVIQASDGGNVNFDVSGNNGVTGALSGSNAINIKTDNADLAGAASNATGTISNNLIGNASVGSGAKCGGGCSGIQVAQQHGGVVTVDITGNNIRHVDVHGIRFLSGNGAGKLITTVTGNLIQDPDNSPVQTLAAINVASGTVGGDTGCLQATIGGTVVPGAWPTTAANTQNRILGNWDPTPGGIGNEIFLWETGTSTLAVPGASLPVSTFVASRNSIASVDGTSVSQSGNVVAGTCP